MAVADKEVAQRLARTQQAIAKAALEAGREPAEIRLLAVSKRQSSGKIRQAYAAGQRDFGESYVQELALKVEELADLSDIRWHLIGHVQSRKAKTVAELNLASIQSVDSLKLARALDKARQPSAEPLRILIQVNISGEAQKFGVRDAELEGLVDAVRGLPKLRLDGLMGMASMGGGAEAERQFACLARDAERFGLGELSMGMSGDLAEAISAGATMVRIGTAVFGAR